MTKSEIAELEGVLAQMTAGDLTKIKKLVREELDRREPRAKAERTIHPHMAWGEILTRSGIDV